MAPSTAELKSAHFSARSISCLRSESKRTACAFAWRVAALSVLSMLYTRICHRSEPRDSIPLFMTFSPSMICVCWHAYVIEFSVTEPTSRVLTLTECTNTTSHTSSRRKKSRRHSTLRVDVMVLACLAADWPRIGPKDFLPRIRRSHGPMHPTNGPHCRRGTLW